MRFLQAPLNGDRQALGGPGPSMTSLGRSWPRPNAGAQSSTPRRVVTRWEFRAEAFLGLFQLACVRILLRHF